MAVRATTITLDGSSYSVPTLTNDQLERIMDVLTDETMARHKQPFRLLPIMLEFAEPAIDPAMIRSTINELREAIEIILKAAGLKDDTANPPVLAVVPKTDAV